jgi:hypothetical protein
VVTHASQLERGFDGQPPRGPDIFILGMWHWGTPDPRSAPGRVLCGRDGGFPVPHPYLLAHEFQIPSLQWGFPAGTMDACAGRSRHDVPSCRQNPAAAAPRRALFMPIKCGLTVSDHVRPGPARWLTEPQSPTGPIVSRRTGRCSDLACCTGGHRIRAAPLQGRDPSAAVSGPYLGFCVVCPDTAWSLKTTLAV